MSDATLPASMQRIVLRRRPEGLLTWDDVELLEVPLPVPGPGQATVPAVRSAVIRSASAPSHSERISSVC